MDVGANSDSEALLVAVCLLCTGVCRLVGIEPTEKPYDYLYTFECRDCGHIDVRTVRMQ